MTFGCEKSSPRAPQESSEPSASATVLRGTPDQPAVFSVVSPTLELSRSTQQISINEAERLLSLTNVTVAHFPVDGETAADAVKSARQRGHFDTASNGIGLTRRPAGHTTWRVEWSLVREGQDPSSPTKLNVTWAAFVVMPRWSGTPQGTEGRIDHQHERQQWDAFYSSLRVHEAHHVSGVVKMLAGLQQSLQDEGKVPRTMEEANRVMGGVLQNISQHDREIDLRFGHQ